MIERQQLVSEYFKLYVLLNKANRHRNEKTELSFEFLKSSDYWELFASLRNSSEDVKLKICDKKYTENWEATGLSGLHKLEAYIAKILNNEHKSLNIQKRQVPDSKQLEHLKEQIRKQLRSLCFE